MDKTYIPVSGWKLITIRFDDNNREPLFDVAFFGSQSIISENFQLCERIEKGLSYDDVQRLKNEIGDELPHNYINDLLVIK